MKIQISTLGYYQRVSTFLRGWRAIKEHYVYDTEGPLGTIVGRSDGPSVVCVLWTRDKTPPTRDEMLAIKSWVALTYPGVSSIHMRVPPTTKETP